MCTKQRRGINLSQLSNSQEGECYRSEFERYQANTSPADVYPRQPPIREECSVNQLYNTLPPGTRFERVRVGNSIYTDIPNSYEVTYKWVPVDSMYGIDNSRFGAFGRRETYHQQVYPFTNRNIQEFRSYASPVVGANSQGLLSSNTISASKLQKKGIVIGGMTHV